MGHTLTVTWRNNPPNQWWEAAEFTLTNNTATDLVDPLIEFTVDTNQKVEDNSGLHVSRPEGSNHVKARLADWLKTIKAHSTVTFSVGMSPVSGAAQVGPLPRNLKINGDGGDDMDMLGAVAPLRTDLDCDGLDVNVTVNVNINAGGSDRGWVLPNKKVREHEWFKCSGHEKYSSDEWSYLNLNLCCRERKTADGYEYEITWDGAAQYYWGAAWYWDKYGGQFEWEIYDDTTLSASGKDSMSGQKIVHNDPIVVKYKGRPSSLKLNFIKTGGYWETKGYPTSARIYDAIDLPRSGQ